MELSDIMSVEDWKTIAENIYKKFGMNGTVYKKDNSVLVKSGQWANQLCPAIKSGDSAIICSSVQQRLSKIAKESKNFVVDECDAGCIKFLVPVFINDEFVGMAGGCGCISGKSEVDAFYVAKLLKKDQEDIERLLTTVRHISQDKVQEAIRYVQEELKEISANKSF